MNVGRDRDLARGPSGPVISGKGLVVSGVVTRIEHGGIARGTLQPLVECETAEGDAPADCGCQDGVPVWVTPEACSGLSNETTPCGG